MRLCLLLIALLFAACIGPASDAELAKMGAEDLAAELRSPVAWNTEYARFDSTYLPKVLARLVALEGWSKRDCERVASGNIWIGATPTHVLAAWGRPSDRDRTVTAWGTAEVWYYHRSYDVSLVTFDDGRVSSWTR